MIHATKLTHNHATYNDVYLFLKLYFTGAGTAEAEAIMYGDQTIKDQIGAMRLPNYTFEELGNDPLTTLHDLTIAQLQAENPQATFTIVNIITDEQPTESETN
jgi:hypothetical protein